jgi:hypothetical protein
MKLFVQARKDGYNILYPTPSVKDEFYQFADDIQQINAKNNEIYYGKNFYSLAFASTGCIFTKYVIGYDVQRNYLGNVGISVFIPNTKKLSGNDVKVLLDDLLNTYCRNYCSDNNISDKREDWILLTALAASFDAKLLTRSSNYNNITAGSQDPAFHYYKSESELIDHFDKPFQEEYSDYKQILFIDSNLQGASNPLNVLKNSGVEVNPDLKNEYYYLNNFNSSRGIKITADGKSRSDKKGENQIRAKWQVEIKYSKDDRCFEPIFASGTISDLSSVIHKYLEIKGNQILLQYAAFNNPIEREKPVTFEIKDQNGKSIEGTEIQIGTRPLATINESSTTIDFKGEDIVKNWTISAKKSSENLYSNTVTVTPVSQIGTVVLTLQRQKKIKIFAIDKENGNNISNFKFWCNDSKGYRENVTEIIFANDDIDKTWVIEVSKKAGQDTYSGKIEFCPATGENPLYVPCQKSTDVHSNSKTYKIDAGEHGKKTENCPSYSNSRSGNDLVKNCIIAKKGYVFKNWELKNDTIVAKYVKKRYFYQNPKFIAGSVAGILIISICIGALYHFLGKDKTPNEIPLTTQEITAYLEGDALMLDKLKTYKADWEKQKPEIVTIDGKPWYNPTTWFVGNNEAISDSADYKEWDKSNQGIDSAIIKRNFINSKNFTKLKNQIYSTAQQSLKTAIEKIDSTKYLEVGTQLGNVSTLTLTQIAVKINEILKPEEPAKEETPQDPKKETPQSALKPAEQAKPQEQKTAAPPTQQETVSSDITSEIIQYIKGSEFKKEILNQYLKDAGKNTTLKASINLCLKLWSLDGTRNNSYSSYLVELNEDTNLKNSELKNFVDAMCGKEKPKYIKELPAFDQSKSLSQIKSKIQ